MDTSNAELDFDRQLTQWRHRFHRVPETGFEEHETSAFAAAVLEGFGLEVTRVSAERVLLRASPAAMATV